jgi:cytochrome c
MKTLISALSILLLATHAVAAEAPKKPAEAAKSATEVPKLAMPADGKSKCGACHNMEGESVGPAWQNVAAKYKGKANAEKTLVENITKGGKFGWYKDKPMKSGMPAKGMGASEAQIAALAKFIAVEMNASASKPAAAKTHKK